MGKRVKQADGSYCYTENCRKHDRGGADAKNAGNLPDQGISVSDSFPVNNLASRSKNATSTDAIEELEDNGFASSNPYNSSDVSKSALMNSTGIQAVMADIRESRRQVIVKESTTNLQKSLSHLSEKEAHDIADRVSYVLAHNNSNHMSSKLVAEEILGAAENMGIEMSPLDSRYASYSLYETMRRVTTVKQGDEVMLLETGERGTVSEGSTQLDGVARFNSENSSSRNSSSWFEGKSLMKVEPNPQALAREQIFATPRDALISPSLVKQMLDEETSTETRNPQAVREFNKSTRAVATETLRSFGSQLEERFANRSGITKNQAIDILKNEYFRPVTGMKDKDIRASKAGLRNILDYLDPTY